MLLLRKLDIIIKFLFDGDVPLRNKLGIIIGIAYFVLPIDILPELAFLGIGYIDDIILLGYIYNRISKDIHKYEQELKVKEEVRKKEKGFKDKIIENVEYKVRDENEES